MNSDNTAWVIYADYLAEPGDLPGSPMNAVGLFSRNWTADTETPVRFRLLDDDGNICYEGWMGRGADFAPLDEFGIANAGCTTLEYEDSFGQWVAL